ncbi:MAG TPA: hypothetical protein PKC28_08820 [Bdellovibrionales bacterium]|nr:hypothetical protein [Bdellovibrionales bacterium]
MTEAVFIYTFFGLMAFNLLASLLYLYGLAGVKTAVIKAFRGQQGR